MRIELKRLTTKFCRILQHHGVQYALFRFYRYFLFHYVFTKWKKNSTEPVLPPAPIELITGLKEKHPRALRKAHKLIGNLLHTTVSIQGEYVCIHGQKEDFSNTTTAILAHWDPHSIADPYVINMCRHFKSLGWKVILASANKIQGIEENPDWADAILYRRCYGYDFTSWKAALDCFSSLWNCNEIILCNDSVFAPIGSYAPMHEKMQNISCDFWGITESRDLRPHLQSFHLVFRRAALQHYALKQFFNAVQMSDDRIMAIDYETTLSIWLALHGLCPAAFAPLIPNAPFYFNAITYQWAQLIEAGVPLLKRELLINTHLMNKNEWNSISKMKKYDVTIIENYLSRVHKYFYKKR